MTTIRDLVLARGGVATTRQLLAEGAHDRHLTAAVRSGEVRRARNGWYSTWEESDPRFQALRVGGRLTGLSAIAAMGGWVREKPPLHVSVPVNAARLRRRTVRHPFDYDRPQGVRLHWESRDLADRGGPAIVALRDALVRVLLDESLEDAVAALDWALHEQLIDASDLAWLATQVPARCRTALEWADPDCHSLPESLARVRARLAGHRVRTQVHVEGASDGDILVDECVLIEVDGDEFHRDRFLHDRTKDLDATIARLHVIRPAAVHVFREWPRVLAAVECALHERGVRAGNSGVPVAAIRASRPRAGRNGHRARRTPEFPHDRRGNRARVRAGWGARE